MKIMINVSAKAALLEGKNTHGNQIIDVDPAQLTPEERQELAQSNNHRDLVDSSAEFYANMASSTNRYFSADMDVSEASLASLKILLAARIAQRAATLREREEARAKRVREFLTRKPQEFFSRDEFEGRRQPSWADNLTNADIAAAERDAVAAHRAEVTALCEELSARYEIAEAERTAVRKQRERELAEKATAKAREEEESASRKTAQIAAWVAEHGTDNQRARLRDGVLPDYEIINLIRDLAFAPLTHSARYEKLKKTDVCEGDEEYDRHDVDFSAEAAETMSADEYMRMKEFRALMPGATITLRRHTGRCDQCENSVTRAGIMVALAVGAFNFSREYSA